MPSDCSIVEYRAEHEGYRCGYCHSDNTNFSHGMWAHQLLVGDYQDMIDRGWRRSGKYTYKPTMNKTCCPQYPIRCAVAELRLTKSQKKAIKRVNRYLNYGQMPGTTAGAAEERGHEEMQGPRCAVEQSDEMLRRAEVSVKECVGQEAKEVAAVTGDEERSKPEDKPKSNLPPKPGAGPDPTKPLAKKAKIMRLERKRTKQAANSTSTTAAKDVAEKPKAKQKSLEDYLNDIVDKPAHTLEIKLVSCRDKSKMVTYNVYKKYQIIVHKEDEEECSSFSYDGFLVDSPLIQPKELEDNNLPDGYGSFHQHYILDGKIIAVGVIDILPRCVSAVYFYYDPDYAFLSLGTYSALRELAFTRYLHELQPEIAYYYLGFYIHSCPKMRYKGQYSPSFLLCPETYKWFPLEECCPKLDVNKYCRFAPPDAADEDHLEDLGEILCLFQQTVIPYSMYLRRSKSKAVCDPSEVRQYADLIGAKVARRMLLYRSK